MELSRYEKSLTIEALVLLELQDARSISGNELISRIEARCSSVAEKCAEFGFVGWLGTTIWGLLDTFADTGFISHSGRRPLNSQEWRTATLLIQQPGERFLESAKAEAPQIYQLLDIGSISYSAVG